MLKTRLPSFAKLMMGLTAILIATISYGHAQSRGGFDLTATEEKLLTSFEQKCSSHELRPSQFPDGFMHPGLLAACEIASFFNFEKNLHNLALLRAGQASYGIGQIRSEWLLSLEARAKYYGYEDSLSSSNTSNNTANIEVMKRAFLGDPASIYDLSLNADISIGMGGKGVTLSQADTLGDHIGEELSYQLFLNEEDYQQLYNNYDAVNNAAIYLISHAHHISHWYLELAAQRLIFSAMSLNDHERSWTIEALLFPHELRMNLLKLNSLTNALPEGLRNAIWIIELNAKEKFNSFMVGADFDWVSIERKDADTTFAACAQGLSDSLSGVVQFYSASFYAECISNHHAHFPTIIVEYQPHINGVSLQSVQNFSPENYQKWIASLSDKPAHNDIYLDLLSADIRHYLNHTSHKTDAEKQRIEALWIDDPNWAITLASKHLAPAVSLLNAQQSKSFADAANINFSALFNQLISTNDYGCDDVPKSLCRKIWRELDWSLYLAEEVSITLPTPHQPTNICKISDVAKKIVWRQIWAGKIEKRLISNCPRSFFTTWMMKGQNFNAFLSNFTAIPASYSGVNLLGNSDFFTEKDFGLLAAHLLKSTPDRRATVLPENLNIIAQADPTMAALHHELLISAPMLNDSGNIEDLGFAPNKDKLSYWDTQKPYAQLSNSYYLQGANELAFLAKIADINKMLDAPEFYDKPSAKIKLLDTVISARQANIPEIFVAGLNTSFQQRFTSVLSDSTPLNEQFESENMAGDYAVSTISAVSKIVDRALGKNTPKEKLPWTSALENEADFKAIFETSLNYTRSDVERLCATPEAAKLLISIHQDSTAATLLNNSLLFSMNVYFEWVKFVSECRTVAVNSTPNHQALSANIYDFLIGQDISSFLDFGGNPIHPAFFPIYAELAFHSYKNDRIFGAVVALAALKQNLGQLTDAFVNRDSQALRQYQTDIEMMLSNLAPVIVNYQNGSGTNAELGNRLFELSQGLSANFHFPVLSKKSRARIVFGTSLHEVDPTNSFAEREYVELNRHFDSMSDLIANSKTPLDYALFSAQRAAHKNLVSFNAFRIYNDLVNFVSGGNTQLMKPDSVILNIMASDENLLVQAMSAETGFVSHSVTYDGKTIQRVKKQIAKNKDITTHDIEDICAAFQALHHYMATSFHKQNDQLMAIVVPSVNLTPIPTELILGMGCHDYKFKAIFHAGDAMAALEFAILHDQLLPRPEMVVGVGNPTLRSTGFNMGFDLSVKRSGGQSNQKFNIDDFPPLPDAAQEVEEIATLFNDSEVLLNEDGSIYEALNKAEQITKSDTPVALVFATHGVAVDYDADILMPALLSSEDGNLHMFESSRLSKYDLKGSIVALSACDTATGFTDKSDLYFTGFVAGFANAGTDVVMASLWPVVSSASKRTNEAFFKTWSDTNVFDAAGAARRAVTDTVSALPFVFIYP